MGTIFTDRRNAITLAAAIGCKGGAWQEFSKAEFCQAALAHTSVGKTTRKNAVTSSNRRIPVTSNLQHTPPLYGRISMSGYLILTDHNVITITDWGGDWRYVGYLN